MSNQTITTKEVLRQMRGHIDNLKLHKPSEKLIPLMLALIEGMLVILERQDLR
jgi:hypothetical protein